MSFKKITSVLLAVLLALTCFVGVASAVATRDDVEAAVAAYVPTAPAVNTSMSSLKSTLGTVLSILGKGDADALIANLINTKVLTNATVGKLIAKMFTKLAAKFANDAMVGALIAKASPARVGQAMLTDEGAAAACAKAIAKLNAAGEDWSKVAFVNGDMGFQDGDAEGFTLAFARMFLFVKATGYDSLFGLYQPAEANIYRHLVPVYGTLGLRARSTEAFAADNGAAADLTSAICDVLDPITALVKSIAGDPMNKLAEVLPKLAYVLDSGMLNVAVADIFADSSFLMGAAAAMSDSIDLSTKGVYALVDDLSVAGYAVADIVSEQKFVTLMKELAGCGSAAVGEDVDGNAIVAITPDADKVASVLMSHVLEFLRSENGKAIVDGVLAAKHITGMKLKIVNLGLRLVNSLNPSFAVRVLPIAMRFAGLAMKVLRLFKGLTDGRRA